MMAAEDCSLELLNPEEVRTAQQRDREREMWLGKVNHPGSVVILRDGVIYQATPQGPKPVLPVELRYKNIKKFIDFLVTFSNMKQVNSYQYKFKPCKSIKKLINTMQIQVQQYIEDSFLNTL
jgi:IS4 transposase